MVKNERLHLKGAFASLNTAVRRDSERGGFPGSVIPRGPDFAVKKIYIMLLHLASKNLK